MRTARKAACGVWEVGGAALAKASCQDGQSSQRGGGASCCTRPLCSSTARPPHAPTAAHARSTCAFPPCTHGWPGLVVSGDTYTQTSTQIHFCCLVDCYFTRARDSIVTFLPYSIFARGLVLSTTWTNVKQTWRRLIFNHGSWRHRSVQSRQISACKARAVFLAGVYCAINWMNESAENARDTITARANPNAGQC